MSGAWWRTITPAQWRVLAAAKLGATRLIDNLDVIKNDGED